MRVSSASNAVHSKNCLQADDVILESNTPASMLLQEKGSHLRLQLKVHTKIMMLLGDALTVGECPAPAQPCVPLPCHMCCPAAASYCIGALPSTAHQLDSYFPASTPCRSGHRPRIPPAALSRSLAPQSRVSDLQVSLACRGDTLSLSRSLPLAVYPQSAGSSSDGLTSDRIRHCTFDTG